jgi:hypothetical protein
MTAAHFHQGSTIGDRGAREMSVPTGRRENDG